MATVYSKQYVFTSGGVDFDFRIAVFMRTGVDDATGEPTNTIQVTHNDTTQDSYPGVKDYEILQQVQFYYQLEIDTVQNVPNRDVDTQLLNDGFTPNYNA